MRRWFAFLGVSIVGLGMTGCVSKVTHTTNLPVPDEKGGYRRSEIVADPPPEVSPTIRQIEPARIAAAWSNVVQIGADTTKGGAPFPCLSCRVYIFGKDQTYPLNADGGHFIVRLYDATPKENPADENKLLELWNIDSTKLPVLKKKDLFGEGYSLILPWSTYSPDVRKISVTVEYRYQSDLPALPTSVPASFVEPPFSPDPSFDKAKDVRKLVSVPEVLTVDHSVVLSKVRERTQTPTKPDATLPEPKSLPPLITPGKP